MIKMIQNKSHFLARFLRSWRVSVFFYCTVSPPSLVILLPWNLVLSWSFRLITTLYFVMSIWQVVFYNYRNVCKYVYLQMFIYYLDIIEDVWGFPEITAAEVRWHLTHSRFRWPTVASYDGWYQALATDCTSTEAVSHSRRSKCTTFGYIWLAHNAHTMCVCVCLTFFCFDTTLHFTVFALR